MDTAESIFLFVRLTLSLRLWKSKNCCQQYIAQKYGGASQAYNLYLIKLGQQ